MTLTKSKHLQYTLKYYILVILITYIWNIFQIFFPGYFVSFSQQGYCTYDNNYLIIA